jgi:hypothetical protein
VNRNLATVIKHSICESNSVCASLAFFAFNAGKREEDELQKSKSKFEVQRKVR